MKNKFSLEEKMNQLEKIEEYFSRPDMDLEQSIKKHEEALVVAQDILAYLKKAESSLEQLDRQLIMSSTNGDSNDISEK